MEITSTDMAEFNKNPLYRTLGIRILEVGAGAARSQLEPEENVCWPFPGQPHGGVIYTLVDTTMAWAILSGLENGYNCATIHLDIQYTAPAKGRRFSCASKSVFQTGRIHFMQAEVRDSEERLVAMAQGTFRVIKAEMRKR
ncbi:MAG: PaaI family thioesterase [Desulfobacterales bacterium]|nr:PaaI family thioesterase [Desulfobacterales bacterium]